MRKLLQHLWLWLNWFLIVITLDFRSCNDSIMRDVFLRLENIADLYKLALYSEALCFQLEYCGLRFWISPQSLMTIQEICEYIDCRIFHISTVWPGNDLLFLHFQEEIEWWLENMLMQSGRVYDSMIYAYVTVHEPPFTKDLQLYEWFRLKKLGKTVFLFTLFLPLQNGKPVCLWHQPLPMALIPPVTICFSNKEGGGKEYHLFALSKSNSGRGDSRIGVDGDIS